MKVIIATTGAGGHLTCAIALAEELKKRDAGLDLYFVVSRHPISQTFLGNTGYKVNSFNLKGLDKSFSLQNLFLIIKLLITSVRSLLLVAKIRPDQAVGFGGYISGPIILFSHFFGARTIIHEQNLRLGVANRLLSRFVDKIALSFADSKTFLDKPYLKNKLVVTGNPSRSQFLTNLGKDEAKNYFGLDSDRFTILVMGGSLGAQHINHEFINMLNTWHEPPRIQIIHLTGAKDYENIKSSYESLNIPYKIFAHLETMQYAYGAGDIVIARAGATTIAELSLFGIPAILVPYPYARGQHQLENAINLKENGAAILIKDDELNPSILKSHLLELINNPQKLRQISGSIKRFARPEASRNLADLVRGIN